MSTGTCETCGAPIERRYRSRPGRFCSSACYHGSGAKRGTAVALHKKPPMRTARGHPIAPPSGMVAISRLVLYEKIGPGPHRCHWCGTSVDWMPGAKQGAKGSLVADHLNWDWRDNDPVNLVASCHACNAHRTRKGDRRRLQDGELIVASGSGQRTRATERTCEYCGGTFVARISQVKVGKGRFCSRSCARRSPRNH